MKPALLCYNSPVPDDPGHIPVLLDETLALLDPQPGETAVDLTLGRGGHALALAEAIRAEPPPADGPAGRLIAFDLDPANLAFASQRLRDAGFTLDAVHDSFVRVEHHLRQREIAADVVLADLGFASTQMDDPLRGFSFSTEGPLDMRLDPHQPITAADLLRTLSEQELADVIFRYGEEPLARRIAQKLVQRRQVRPIDTTTDLAALVEETYGRRARHSRMHPATRTFMALRIAVNDELSALDALLSSITRGVQDRVNNASTPWLQRGARLAIISFHSLEDRLVKRAFAELDRRGFATRLTRKPVTADDNAIRRNPRARSARLRALRLRPRLENHG